MAATFTVRFESSSVAACAAAIGDLADAVIRVTPAAVVRGGGVIQAGARRNASGRPGPDVITGALRSSILIGPGDSSGAVGAAVAAPAGPYRWSVIIGPSVIYGRIQELGGNVYPHHMARSGSGRPGMLGWGGSGPMNRTHFARHVYLPPRPYLAPAVVQQRAAVQQSFYDSWLAAWKAA